MISEEYIFNIGELLYPDKHKLLSDIKVIAKNIRTQYEFYWMNNQIVYPISIESTNLKKNQNTSFTKFAQEIYKSIDKEISTNCKLCRHRYNSTSKLSGHPDIWALSDNLESDKDKRGFYLRCSDHDACKERQAFNLEKYALRPLRG